MINRRLYDILIRHQIYVEGFKNYQSEVFRKLLPDLIKELKQEFKKVLAKHLDEMTKREVNKFKTGVSVINKKFGNYYYKLLLKTLNEFLIADLAMNKQMLANFLLDSKKPIIDDIVLNEIIRKNKIEEDEDKPLHFAWIFGNRDSKIKDAILASIVPAVGLLPENYLAKFTNSIDEKIQAEINKGWADNLTVEEIFNNITGTKQNNFKDGIMLGIGTAADTTLKTLFQNTTSIISAGVFGMAYKKYVWVSVIDSVTSDICLFRNMKIYTYGKGPLPPAHPRCRSKTVPFTGAGNVPNETFTEWTNLQPTKIKKYVSDKFPSLSLDQYSSKIEDILTR